ncbi:uncharacterized protein LOC142977937 [Anticarsia gemmatalis]|uniref:uncharacterized protein LOC142977937 n=1 Tax=Anticarsia gemmatalis TaxID=129554 RepID=UPI003F75CBF3
MGDRDDFEDSQFPDNNEYVPYVTGSNLSQKSNGAKVTLWGKVTKEANEGFYIKTLDGKEVLIKLKKPLSESTLGGWFEIHGQSQGNSVLCEDYVPFSEEMTKNIDTVGHETLAKFLVALDDPWNLGDAMED